MSADQIRHRIADEAWADLLAAGRTGRTVEIEVCESGAAYVVIAGDIGEPVRRIEFEPMPEEAPAEPVRTPQPVTTPKEPVPA